MTTSSSKPPHFESTETGESKHRAPNREPAGAGAEERAARRAEALRANLRRRKDQSRARKTAEDPEPRS